MCCNVQKENKVAPKQPARNSTCTDRQTAISLDMAHCSMVIGNNELIVQLYDLKFMALRELERCLLHCMSKFLCHDVFAGVHRNTNLVGASGGCRQVVRSWEKL